MKVFKSTRSTSVYLPNLPTYAGDLLYRIAGKLEKNTIVISLELSKEYSSFVLALTPMGVRWIYEGAYVEVRTRRKHG